MRLSFWGCQAPAQPPEGYAYLACPPLVTLDDKRALVGKPVLTSLDGGWYFGTVFGDVVSAAGKKLTPGATHIVQYVRSPGSALPQVPRDLVGKKPMRLTAAAYGRAKLWVLLQKLAAAGPSAS